MSSAKVIVGVRLKPKLFNAEKLRTIKSTNSAIHICNGHKLSIICDEKKTKFEYDHIFNSNIDQLSIYDKLCKPLVQKLFDGYNATFFAYGQTNSGKTYTMGLSEESKGEGIVPYTLHDLFEKKSCYVKLGYTVTIELSMVQKDLEVKSHANHPKTKKKQLDLRVLQSGETFLDGVTNCLLNDKNHATDLIMFASNLRKVSTTAMNSSSSRSHAICCFVLNIFDPINQTQTKSKLNLVDLAGSERISKSESNRDTMLQGVKINQGLLALGKVVSALSSISNKSLFYNGNNNPNNSTTRKSISPTLSTQSNVMTRIDSHYIIDQDDESIIADSRRSSIRSTNTDVCYVSSSSVSPSSDMVTLLSQEEIDLDDDNKENTSIDDKSIQSISETNSIRSITRNDNSKDNFLKINLKPPSGHNSQGSIHIPYRDSKLTFLLKDSLGGNGMTVLLACISQDHIEETINTLQFAARASKIINKVKVNKENVQATSFLPLKPSFNTNTTTTNNNNTYNESIDSNPLTHDELTIENKRLKKTIITLDEVMNKNAEDYRINRIELELEIKQKKSVIVEQNHLLREETNRLQATRKENEQLKKQLNDLQVIQGQRKSLQKKSLTISDHERTGVFSSLSSSSDELFRSYNINIPITKTENIQLQNAKDQIKKLLKELELRKRREKHL
eukprot:gene6024-8296_t